MKTRSTLWRILFAITLLPLAVPSAFAGIHLTFGIWHGYDFYYPNLGLTVSDVPTTTYHRIESPSGVLWINRGGGSTNNPFFLTNLTQVISESTNGLWKLYVNKDDASEQVYYFTISVTGVTSNVLGDVEIFSPLSGSTGVPDQPPVEWIGPDNFLSIDLSLTHDVSGNSYFQTLSGTATSWEIPGPLTPGPNSLFVHYYWNNFPGITISTPTNALGEPLSDWSAEAGVHTYLFSSFTVAGGNPPGGGSLFAHFTFDDSNDLGHDDSGGGNDGSVFYPGDGNQFPEYNPDGISGGAVEFDGLNGIFWDGEMTNAFTGSYSVSLWLKTSQSYGSDEDSADSGAIIFDAGASIPLALTGNKLAFQTGYGSSLLHSGADINFGEFVHLVVTRNADTGEKQIYFNGELDSTEFDDAGAEPPAFEVRLGYSFISGQGIEGLVDDLQIYSAPLSPDQVAYLFDHPGEIVVGGNSSLGDAVDAPELTWTTGGDAPWVAQTMTTFDGSDAAKSGAIDDYQESWIETTVQGPGELTFWWKVSSEDGADYLEFTIDDEYQNDISGDWDWEQQTYQIEPGTHTLRWRYSKDSCCTDYDDAAYLDQVTFNQPAPSLTFSLSLYREVRSGFESFSPGETTFFAFPNLQGFNDPISYHLVESPDAFCQSKFGSDGGSSSGILTSFDTLLNRLTNGVWKLWLNKETPQEKFYTFTVSVADLSSNALGHVIITSPLDAADAISPNTAYQWTGPTGWTGLRVRAWQPRSGGDFQYANSPLPPDAQSWIGGPTLASGTNYFTVDYENVITNFTVTIPYPEFSIGEMTVHSTAKSGFIVTNPSIALLNPKLVGSNLEFSFQSQNGMTHVLLSRTNLTLGAWQTNSLVIGDGTLKLISVPKTNSQEYFRISTY